MALEDDWPRKRSLEKRSRIQWPRRYIRSLSSRKPSARKRVYEALTETNQFDKVIELGAGKNSALGNKPTQISREVGGAFVLFGGHIVGRQIELMPDERIVHRGWRVVDWRRGSTPLPGSS